MRITFIRDNKDLVGNDIQLDLKPGDYVYSETNHITNSMRIYSQKGLIKIEDRVKPEGLNYYIGYNKPIKQIIAELNTPTEIDVPESPQEEVDTPPEGMPLESDVDDEDTIFEIEDGDVDDEEIIFELDGEYTPEITTPEEVIEPGEVSIALTETPPLSVLAENGVPLGVVEDKTKLDEIKEKVEEYKGEDEEPKKKGPGRPKKGEERPKKKKGKRGRPKKRGPKKGSKKKTNNKK